MNKYTYILTLSFILALCNFAIGQPDIKLENHRRDSILRYRQTHPLEKATVPLTPAKQNSPKSDDTASPIPIPPVTAQNPAVPSDMTNPVLTSITEYVKKIVDFAFPYALVASLVGALSMALLQTLKDIFPIRSWFQKARLRKWYEDKQGKMSKLFQPENRQKFTDFLKFQGLTDDQIQKYLGGYSYANDSTSKSSFEVFQYQLLSLSTDGNESAFYDLPIEQMCGQMNTCAQLAIEYPIRFTNVLSPLVASADPLDIYLLFLLPTPIQGMDNPDTKAINSLYSEARNRIGHHIQRAVDAIQISFGSSWKKYMQVASIILSGLICALGVGFLDTQMTIFQRIALALVSAVLGGFLAPVARDLVAALQKLRS
jgi:hypothetical protein